MATSAGLSAATATATAAAAASSKHRPARLPTPKSATYPSSLHSPLVPTPTHLQREESLKTPITPPSAYLDFLSKLSPAIKSPLSTGNSTTFSFLAPRSPASALYTPGPASARPVITSNPSTSSVDSRDSLSSSSSAHTTQSAPVANSSKPVTRNDTDSSSSFPPYISPAPRSATIPPARPNGPIRRPSLMIPPSPTTGSPSLMSPASVGASARLTSPVSAGAAAKAYYTSMSPVDPWGQALSAGAGQTRPVSVRHVITRTVTYTRPRSGDQSATDVKPETPVGGASADNESEMKPPTQPRSPVATTKKPLHAPLVGEAPRGKRRRLD